MRPSPGIRWVVETRGVTIAGADGLLRLSIPYPFAAVWALLAHGNYSPELAADLLASLAPMSPGEARRAVGDALRDGQEAGLLAAD